MKLVYYSSVMNHHQRALCDEFYRILGDDFIFVETMPMEQQRIKLGYLPDSEAPYIIQSYKSSELYAKAYQAAVEADVFLAGVFPPDILHERMRTGKLTFRHIETYFRHSKCRLFTPRALRIAYGEHAKYRNKALYLLCASSHVARDVQLFGAYPGKKYKWGYFPILDEKYVFSRDNRDVIELLWVGRMLKLKKPEYAIRVLRELTDAGFKVHLNMIGNGVLESQLKELARNLNVEELISFRGGMSPQEVKKYMQSADIFLFTSTREEGWGAVLNEAMQCGCAAVASREAGSTNYLIPNEQFGLTYPNNKYSEFKKCVMTLCQDDTLRKNIGLAAKKRIDSLWNYSVAAERFVNMSEALLSGKVITYNDGPMSKGE